MKKVISFDPCSQETFTMKTYPIPSVKFIPDWYKKIPPFTDGAKKLKFPMGHGMPNSTLKKCIPFLDAITLGYMFYLSEDVYVEQIDEEPFIRWRSNDEIISWHSLNQYEGFHIPDTHHNMVAKWANHWVISLPKDYSILFSHPSNRLDLPFFTLSGFVSLDTYPNPVQFPFILKKGFEGIIEAGTPVCQLTIVKNEQWKTEVKEYDAQRIYKYTKMFWKTFVGSYKKNFWKRHSYE